MNISFYFILMIEGSSTCTWSYLSQMDGRIGHKGRVKSRIPIYHKTHYSKSNDVTNRDYINHLSFRQCFRPEYPTIAGFQWQYSNFPQNHCYHLQVDLGQRCYELQTQRICSKYVLETKSIQWNLPLERFFIILFGPPFFTVGFFSRFFGVLLDFGSSRRIFFGFFPSPLSVNETKRLGNWIKFCIVRVKLVLL